MSAPSRKLGLVAATAIVVANMIGTGIFTTSGFMAADLGDAGAILIGWLVGGVLALCGAAVYAELAVRMPRVGGEYVYLRQAYHPVVGFLSGWVSLIAGFSAPIAAAAIAFDGYVHAVFEGLPARWPAVVLIVLMTAVHATDVVLGSRVQTAFTVLKVLLIGVFIAAGLAVGEGSWQHFEARGVGLEAVLSEQFGVSLIFVAFTYSGWNAAAYLAGEVRDPERVLPRALLLGTALVTALYVLLNVVYFYAAAPATLAGVGEVGHVAAVALFGREAGNLLSTLIALALVSAVSAMVMAGPRVYTAMAEDHALPSVLARRNRRGAPVLAVLLQGALAIFFVWEPLDQLIRYIGFTLSVFAAATVASVFVFRARERRSGVVTKGYRAIGYPVTPIAFIGLSAWMAFWVVSAQPRAALWAAVTFAMGLLVYVGSRALNRRARRAEIDDA